MDINILRACVTVALFGLFVVLCIWAWSSRRRADFEAAALLPFESGDEPEVARHRNGDTPHFPRPPQAEAAAGNEECSRFSEEPR